MQHIKTLLRGITLVLCFGVVLVSCKKEEPVYAVSGRVLDPFGKGVSGVTVESGSISTITDQNGDWQLSGLQGNRKVVAQGIEFTFTPAFYQVSGSRSNLDFTAQALAGSTEQRILSWFKNQQLANGLLESTENGNVVSLYDNALAAMVFMLHDDVPRAEKIFDFFDARIQSELQVGPGGFSQFRDRNGVPSLHRWMGDNAWMLIALNNYKARTGNNKYNQLRMALANWLISLQDSDGGLWAGYDASNQLLNYKVTEGNIDAYNAIDGYTNFHQDLLGFLEQDRWDSADQSLVAWPTNPTYLYALDCHSWSYCIFNDYPVSTLQSAQRFLTTQTATLTGAAVNGYDIDEDRDAVFMEGTGQMALAFRFAGEQSLSDQYLSEMEKVLVAGTADTSTSGFPYSSNRGTGYGDTPLWSGADTKIAVSPGAWYLFARYGFNPFAVGRKSNIPAADMFWKN